MGVREVIVEPSPFGRGAYGCVYDGRVPDATGHAHAVAVKHMAVPRDDLDAMVQLVREVRALRCLTHPNLLRADGFIALTSTHVGIVTRRYARHLSRFDGTRAATRARVFQAVASGLSHLHAHGCVHCDVKPQNIFLSSDAAECVLGDFGMLQPTAADEARKQAPYIVTSWYRAPELAFASSGRYGDAVDIWSLGCVLAEMILGEALFPVSAEVSLAARHRAAFALPCFDDYALLVGVRTGQAFATWFDQRLDDVVDREGCTHDERKWLVRTLAFDAAERATSSQLAAPAAREPGDAVAGDRICGAADSEVSWQRLNDELAAILVAAPAYELVEAASDVATAADAAAGDAAGNPLPRASRGWRWFF